LVESRERLVEEDDRRLQAQRARQAHPSSFTARQTIGSTSEQTIDADGRRGFVNAAASLGLVDAAQL
jgi:hypothetical protein